MLSIDEAIAHEKELAKEIYVEAMLCHANPDDGELDDCIQRGKYHEQLAEWLEDYKRIKMLIPIEQALKAEYNKAIDDFIKATDKHCGYYAGECRNLTRDDLLCIANNMKLRSDG